MLDIGKNDILQFVGFGTKEQSILLIGCENFFQSILQRLPNAKVYAIKKTDVERAKSSLLCDCLSVKHKESMYFYANSFDYIIVGDCIEQCIDPLGFLQTVRPYLVEDGCLLASFGNVCHWSVLNELMRGQWHYKNAGVIKKNVLRFFTIDEIVRLFEAAKYKEIQFAAVYQEPPIELFERLIDCGFKNTHDNLSVLRWLTCSGRIDKKAKRLRASFEPEVREKLVFLLRRIENDINSTENAKEIFSICEIHTINENYIIDLIESALSMPEKVIVSLAVQFYENKTEKNGIELLQNGYQLYPKSSAILFSLVSLLYLDKQKKAAIDLLSKYQGEDEDILALYIKLRGE